MKISPQIFCAVLITFSINYADAESLKKAYLDKKNNVHVVTPNAKHIQITRTGNAIMLKIAPNGETVTWLALNTWALQDDRRPGAEELVIYRNGTTASIKCTPFIRDYWFWKNGTQIAIDCGGWHFSGREILYDIKTLKELASFDQAEVPLARRPDWSNSDD